MSEYIVPTDVEAVTKDPKLRMADLRQPRLPDHRVQPRQRSEGQDTHRQRRPGPQGVRALHRPHGVAAGRVQRPLRPHRPGASPRPARSMTRPCSRRRRDVAAAKALLKAAGVSTPVVVNLTVPNNPDLRQAGEVIQSMAQEAGLRRAAYGVRICVGVVRCQPRGLRGVPDGVVGPGRSRWQPVWVPAHRGCVQRQPLLERGCGRRFAGRRPRHCGHRE